MSSETYSPTLRLGKIVSAHLESDDGYIKLVFDLAGGDPSWGCRDVLYWQSIERTEHCQWSEEERLIGLGKNLMRVDAIIQSARKQRLADLSGVPIEATFEGRDLKRWRVLMEVL